MPTLGGNETQLYQELQKLIDNALKFIPADRHPKIKIDCVEKEKYYQFSVSDNGIGIAPEMQSKVFLPFKRLHRCNEYKGTGIGLAICQKIVEQHGGLIWVESDGESGSTFILRSGRGRR